MGAKSVRGETEVVVDKVSLSESKTAFIAHEVSGKVSFCVDLGDGGVPLTSLISVHFSASTSK